MGRCTFLGHSTLLLQGDAAGGFAVLTDPILTPRVMLRRRARPLPFPPDRLPKLTVVAISHAHADHLHLPSLKLLPQDCVLVVPEKTARFVKRLGFREVVELGWEQTFSAGGCTLTAWPVNHVRGRFFPWQDTGVNSYVISGAGGDFFVAGDIDFGPAFEMQRVGECFSLAAAALPVGGMREVAYYEKRRGRRGVHIDPATAWELFSMTKARTMVPIHWGAIRFARTPLREPVDRLLEIADAAGCRDRVRVLEPGEAWEW